MLHSNAGAQCFVFFYESVMHASTTANSVFVVLVFLFFSLSQVFGMKTFRLKPRTAPKCVVIQPKLCQTALTALQHYVKLLVNGYSLSRTLDQCFFR